MLAIDNGWAAAPGWGQRVEVGRELIQQAGREGREVVLLPTAPVARPQPLALVQAAAATDALASLGPEPWPVDRAGTAQRLAALDLKDAVPVWLSDGLGDSPARLWRPTISARRSPPRAAQDLRRPAGRAGRPAAPARRAKRTTSW